MQIKFRFKQKLTKAMSHKVFVKWQQYVCQAQKRLAWERSKDKYGPLIHYISQYWLSSFCSCSTMRLEGREQTSKAQLFTFVCLRLSHILPPSFAFLFLLFQPVPLLSLSFAHFLWLSSVRLTLSLSVSLILSAPVWLLKTVWRQCKSTAKSGQCHWVAGTPPPLVIGRRPQRKIQSAGWKCM